MSPEKKMVSENWSPERTITENVYELLRLRRWGKNFGLPILFLVTNSEIHGLFPVTNSERHNLFPVTIFQIPLSFAVISFQKPYQQMIFF